MKKIETREANRLAQKSLQRVTHRDIPCTSRGRIRVPGAHNGDSRESPFAQSAAEACCDGSNVNSGR